MAKIQLKSGGNYSIPKEGSLGLLALGDIGIEAWRASINKQSSKFKVTASKPKSDGSKKLVLIGWDAADWKIINPMLDAGLMPNLSSMINKGVMGNLATLDPPYSPMLWTSIATGKRAYDHGIHGFTEVEENGKGVQPVMSTSRKVKAIWDILGEQNKKCHVVGWWPSHPAEHINGIAISNLYQKATDKQQETWEMPEACVFPATDFERFKKLRVHPLELTKNHILPFVPDAWKIDQLKDKRLSVVAKITAEASSLHNAFTNILRTEDFDFAALYLDAIDHYCHAFMKFFPPHRPHISKPEYDLYKNVIRSAYRFHDMMLGRILELVPDDATVVLISDHGFQPDHLRPRDIPQEPAGPAHEHSPYGIILAQGPNIKKDELIYGASVIDITPTLLHLFDLPVAKDMEGIVLHNLFETYTKPIQIDTFENEVKSNKKVPLSQNSKNQMMDHLVELGYIEDQGSNLAQRIERTQNECDFNLARAYIDGMKIKEATLILEKLFKKNNSTPRYAIRLAGCYQMLGKHQKAREIIKHLKDLGMYQKEAIDVFDGSLLLGNGHPKEALKKFEAARKTMKSDSSELNIQIAQCYLQLNRLREAHECLHNELQHNYDNFITHQLLGAISFRQNNFKQAAEHSLTSLGLNYHSLQSHATLGKSLYKLGQYTDAAHALEQCLILSPQNNVIRELLINIYEKQLLNNDKAKLHKAKLKNSYKGEVFIVSGLPRSGTSMLMQMMVNGGLNAFEDGERKADENNPAGYYEHNLVKNLHRNSNWMHLADHKLVKIVAPIIMHIPLNFKYKIVFIERSIKEVAQSQRKMLTRLQSSSEAPKNLEETLSKSLMKTKTWLRNRPNVELLCVDYNKIINDPLAPSKAINKLFHGQLDEQKMVESVKTDLYREKERINLF